MKPKEIFEGIWYVRALEQRYGDRWDVVMPYEPDEWILSFQPDGYYVEIRRPHRPVGKTWEIKNGIISPVPKVREITKIVFSAMKTAALTFIITKTFINPRPIRT